MHHNENYQALDPVGKLLVQGVMESIGYSTILAPEGVALQRDNGNALDLIGVFTDEEMAWDRAVYDLPGRFVAQSAKPARNMSFGM